MKQFCSSLAFLVISVSFSFAQKANVNAAWSQLKYDELDKAKKNIDLAAVNPQSSGMAKTWYYRGLIYQAMYNHKVYGNLDSIPLTKAFESYKRSLEIEPKGEYSDDINSRIRTVAFYSGVGDYKKKNYTGAFSAFEYVATRNPSDSLALLYAAYCADYGGMNDKAISYFQKLVAMNYSELEPENSNIYFELASLYKNYKKDTAKALEIVNLGVKKYPEAGNLVKEEANLYILTGQYQEAIDRMEKNIRKYPDDSNLHLVLASVYDGMANPKDNSGKGLPKPEKYSELLGKAEEHYRKAIDLKPDYFEAYFNLGAMYFNQGAEMMNEANSKKSDIEFKAAKAKADDKLKQALPYLEKAWSLSPEDQNTMISLKQIYVRTGDTEKYNKVKAALDKVK